MTQIALLAFGTSPAIQCTAPFTCQGCATVGTTPRTHMLLRLRPIPKEGNVQAHGRAVNLGSAADRRAYRQVR